MGGRTSYQFAKRLLDHVPSSARQWNMRPNYHDSVVLMRTVLMHFFADPSIAVKTVCDIKFVLIARTQVKKLQINSPPYLSAIAGCPSAATFSATV